MGLILDSSVLIAAEHKGRNARQALAEIAVRAHGEDVALSVVTVDISTTRRAFCAKSFLLDRLGPRSSA
jgi:hypothetical protein